MEVQVESALEASKEFIPHKKQRDFLSVPFSVKEVLYGGAAGSGKTEILVLMPLIYRFHEHPLYKGLLLRRRLPELETEIIARSKEYYPSFGAVYNEQKKIWTFPSGAKQRFGAADKEDDIRKYDSDQYNLLSFDESTHFTGFQYQYISFTRVRSRTADLPAIIRSGTNPGNVGHGYFKKRFVDPCKTGYKRIIDSATKLERMFIPALLTDNKHLIEASPDYVQQLLSLNEAEKRAKLYGDWDTFEGQVFKEWRIEPLSDEPANARHVIEPFDIPSWWPRFISIDWGFEAYTCIYWAALAPNGRLYIYREYAVKGTLTDDWLIQLVNQTAQETELVVKVRICHSANQHRGEPLTILDKLSSTLRNNNFKCGAELGEKNRLNGKLLIHDFLRWKKKDSIRKFITEEFSVDRANQIYRLYGSDAYQQYVKIYETEEAEDNLPRLQVFNTCPLLIETIPKCVYEDTNESGKKPEDVKEFDGDDPYDDLRILLEGVKDYHITGAKAVAALQETQNALNKLSQGNATEFYRKMERMEAKAQVNYSVRRGSFSRYRRRA